VTDFLSYLGVLLLVYGGVHALSTVQRGREFRQVHPKPTGAEALGQFGNFVTRSAISAVAIWGGLALVGSPS